MYARFSYSSSGNQDFLADFELDLGGGGHTLFASLGQGILKWNVNAGERCVVSV